MANPKRFFFEASTVLFLAASPILWFLCTGEIAPGELPVFTGLLFIPSCLYLIRGVQTGIFTPFRLIKNTGHEGARLHYKQTRAAFGNVLWFMFFSVMAIIFLPPLGPWIDGSPGLVPSFADISRGLRVSQTTTLYLVALIWFYLYAELRAIRNSRDQSFYWEGMGGQDLKMNLIATAITLLLGVAFQLLYGTPGHASLRDLPPPEGDAGLFGTAAMAFLVSLVMAILVCRFFAFVRFWRITGICLNLNALLFVVLNSIVSLGPGHSATATVARLESGAVLSLAFALLAAASSFVESRYPPQARPQPGEPLHLKVPQGWNILFFGLWSVLFLACTLLESGSLWVSLSVLAVVLVFFVRGYRNRARLQQVIDEQTWEISRKNSENEALLLNILPPGIARRLKNGESVIADSFDSVSVLFADIVGFTQLSQTMNSRELVSNLNTLFSAMDESAQSLGIEKIKTIGDCYMAVAGLPEACPDHADRLVALGLRMLEIIDTCNRNTGSTFSIRVGINSGEVVAGIIGTKKFIYDLWGDTVNLASRMESHGLPGQVQISTATRELLKHPWTLEERSNVAIKGKGTMTVWMISPPPDGKPFM